GRWHGLGRAARWTAAATLLAASLPILSAEWWTFSFLRPLSRRRSLERLPFSAGRDHRQGNAPSIHVNGQHPYGHDVSDRYHVVRAFPVTVRQLRNVDEATVFEADVDERPKSTTLSTVPFRSMPGCKSSSRNTPFLKIGLGRSSRGSRPGRVKASAMSQNVGM